MPRLVRVARIFAISFAIWTILALLLAYQIYQNAYAAGRPFTLANDVWPTLLQYWTWALVSPPVYWLCARVSFDAGKRISSTAALTVGFLLVAAAYSALRVTEIRILAIQPVPTYLYFFRAMFKGLLFEQVWMYVTVVMTSYASLYYAAARERDLRAERLRAELAHSSLRILKLQLHPHFLFNSLNGISALMGTDVRRARSMLAELADLLRLVLKHAGEESVPLREELDFVERYLRLQKMRLGDRLQFSMRIQPAVLSLYVPCMLLQPVVENGVRHGVERLNEGGRIEIAVDRTESRVVFQVTNDGPTLAESIEEPSGIGLQNMGQRLLQFYGHNNLKVEDRKDGRGVQVSFDIPASPSPTPHS